VAPDAFILDMMGQDDLDLFVYDDVGCALLYFTKTRVAVFGAKPAVLGA
jgi:hypothetical protein